MYLEERTNPRLFAESDFLVVCLPLSNSTRGLVGAGLLGRLRPSAVLINVARGAVVDEDALFQALTRPADLRAYLETMVPQEVGSRSGPLRMQIELLAGTLQVDLSLLKVTAMSPKRMKLSAPPLR